LRKLKMIEYNDYDNSGVRAALSDRRSIINDYLASEKELLENSYLEKSERTKWWESTITDTRKNAWRSQMSSFKSLAGSMAGLLGSSIKDQAKIMVPFEVAEATKEFARFLGTKDPSALASSLKHTLAAKQYAAAAKSGGAGSTGGGGPSGTGPSNKAPVEQGTEKRTGTARVVVNMDRQVAMVDTYEFARNLIDAINENISDDVFLEVSS
jgi:hypothetical protein